MKTKKLILDFEDTEDFEVLAICAHQPDYRLVWLVNKFADLELQRSDSYYENYSKRGEFVSSHIQYIYHDETKEVSYALIKNKEQNQFLLPELELVDYLLFISTEHEYPTKDILAQLKVCDYIVAVYKIDSSQIKSLSRMEVF